MDIVSTHRSGSLSNNKWSSSSEQNHPKHQEVNRRNRCRTSGFDDDGIQVQIISTCNRSNQQMGYGILVFALCMHNPIFMGALTKIRTRMTNDNSSAFEINKN
ncbi:hypothetical protein Hanom_Chr10g00881171 [Helianthus anomalus]